MTKENCETVRSAKEKIKNGLRNTLGILVDSPIQGSGNTNDGNTARRFFDNIETVANVTGNKETVLL